VADILMALPQVSIPKLRLGASDCRCPAHFFRYEWELPKLRQYLTSLVFSQYPHA
jgi:hypothetical protein